MPIFITMYITLVSVFVGKKLFSSWFNHISIYVIPWGTFIILYELKLISYISLSNYVFSIILLSYIFYLVGILTIFAAKSLYKKELLYFNNTHLTYNINYKYLRNLIIFFTAISFFSAFQHWVVLINKFGDIPTILIKANLIYRQRVSGELEGTIPYIYISGYIAVFLSAIYSAKKNKIGLLSILPILSVILKDIASVGRAGIFVGTLLYVITFLISKKYFVQNVSYKKNTQIIIASILTLLIIFISMTLVKEFRGSVESFKGTSSKLRTMEDIPFLSPSIYMYFSSNIGVLSKYFESENEKTMLGENTFLPIYNLISKFEVIKHPEFYPKGYFIPMWTNSATYLRDLHADFGTLGITLVPYLLGLITTFYWFRLKETKHLKYLILLVYLYLLIAFSVFYMITRSAVWLLSLITLLALEKFISRRNEFYTNEQGN